jgi:mannosyltransferase
VLERRLLNKMNLRSWYFSIVTKIPAIILITILAAALRFYQLGTESYWLDEVYTVDMSQRSADQLIAVRELNWPPAYYLLIHLWMRLFGNTEVATRSLSALAGIASIAIIYAVGRELFGKSVGLIGALLMTMSEFQIYYSQETRFYSLFTFSTILSFFFFIKAMRSNNKKYFFFYIVSSLLLFYSHAFGVFIFASQNIWFLIRLKDHRKKICIWYFCQLILLLAIVTTFLPSILEGKRIAGSGVSSIGWIPDPTIAAPFRTMYQYVFPLRHDRNWMTVVMSFFAGIVFLIIGTALFAHRIGKKNWLISAKKLVIIRPGDAGKANELLLLSCWLICPIIFPFILSKIIGPMYVDRYTLSASPAFCLLLAFGISRIDKIVPARISLAALLVSIAPGLINYYGAPIKEQWREVAALVTANGNNNDVVILSLEDEGWQQKCFNWYYEGRILEITLGKDLKSKNDREIEDILAERSTGHKRFWIIIRASSKSAERLKAFFIIRKHGNMQLIDEPYFKGLSVFLCELAIR